MPANDSRMNGTPGRKKCPVLSFVPRHGVVPLLLVLLWNSSAYYGARIINLNRAHVLLDSAADRAVPFLPWTVSIYLVSYLFWVFNYILICRRGEERTFRFYTANTMAKVTCFIIFLLVPTTNIRPEITGAGLFDRLMQLVYDADMPDNLFPSIHCLASVFAAVGITTDDSIPLWYRIFSWLMAAAICISTVTTKQHALVDIAGGVSLTFVTYAMAKNRKLTVPHRKFVHWIEGLLPEQLMALFG